jgi:4'-phosphopantetheinyl transferase
MSSARPEPPIARCEVWWATARSTSSLQQLLPTAERHRAGELRGDDRARFVTARAVLRLVLSSRLGMDPAEVALDTTCRRCGAAHGKPVLATRTTVPIDFNLAHVGARLVVAVSDGPQVGIDLQPALDRGGQDLDRLASDILNASERSVYRSISSGDRPRALAVWWARKEAALKAIGEGLSVSPSLLEVTAPEEAPAVRSWAPSMAWPGGAPPPMTMWETMATPTLVATLAMVTARGLTVRERDGDVMLENHLAALPHRSATARGAAARGNKTSDSSALH